MRRMAQVACMAAAAWAVEGLLPPGRGPWFLLDVLVLSLAVGFGAVIGELAGAGLSAFLDGAARDRLRARLDRRVRRLERQGRLTADQARRLAREAALFVARLPRSEVKRLEVAYYRARWRRLVVAVRARARPLRGRAWRRCTRRA